MSVSIFCTKTNTNSKSSTEFLNEFPSLLNMISETIGSCLTTKTSSETHAIEWLKRVVEYNVPTGKLLRGKIVELVFKRLVPNHTEELLKITRIMGWCVELLQTSFLLADDIMDHGVTRRGKPCWYTVDNLGNGAINDSFMLEHLAYQVLRKTLEHTERHADMVNIFLEVTWKTILGQSMDLKCSRERCYETFTNCLYNDIAKYKTAYYTFYLPVNVGIILAIAKNSISDFDKDSLKEALLTMGKLFQIQDDYLDCFGDDDTIGKKGNDIQEGKCTWLFVTALQSCKNPIQHSLLVENYGYLDQTKVAKVIEIYRSIGLKQKCFNEQEKLVKEIRKLAYAICCKNLQSVVLDILELIYKRVC